MLSSAIDSQMLLRQLPSAVKDIVEPPPPFLPSFFIFVHSGLLLVQAGKQKPDQAIGRSIAEAVSQVPFISKQDLEQLTNDSAQDVLLIMYLSNLVRTQLALADRLGTAALPLL